MPTSIADRDPLASHEGLIQIDARGHRCPVPSLRLRRALDAAPPGAEVEVLADDPLARIDIPHLVGVLGYRMVLSETVGGYLRFRVLKTPRSTPGGEAPAS